MFLISELKQRRRSAIGFICLIFLLFLYYFVNTHQWTWYKNIKFDGDVHPCATPVKEMDDLKKLIRDVHETLQELRLTHILIYGSLFGAIRYSDPLPWDNDVDMALIYDEVSRMDQKKLFAAFHKRNIEIYYRVWFGTYRVNRDTARGDLMVFRKNYFNEMSRTGIEPWIFFINYRRFHTFPAFLLDKPLPALSFAGVNITVPRSGIEIQKHFYPQDWWKESKPRGC